MKENPLEGLHGASTDNKPERAGKEQLSDFLGEAISEVEKQSEEGKNREYEELRVLLMSVDRNKKIKTLLDAKLNLLGIGWLYFSDIKDKEKVQTLNKLLGELLSEIREPTGQAEVKAKEIADFLDQT